MGRGVVRFVVRVARQFARDHDLPSNTRDILRRLDMALAAPTPFDPAAPLTFQYWRGRTWQYDTI
jgi:hypothetical protein